MRARTLITTVIVILLLCAVVFVGAPLVSDFGRSDEKPELLLDRARLFDEAGQAQIVDYHDALRDYYDIDYRVVTTKDAPDLNRFAAEAFTEQRVGSLSESGKGLLLAINPQTDKVRLEVGRNLIPPP